MSDESVEIKLGQETYNVHPQPHPRITRILPKIVQGGTDKLDLDDLEGFVASLGEQVHDVLQVFIPDLMSAYKFNGYESEQAARDGEETEAGHALAPTPPQILDAFEAAFAVNGGDRFQRVMGKLVGPALKAQGLTLLAQGLTEFSKRSRSQSGDSPSPSSGTTDPTSEIESSSASSDSSTSTTPEPSVDAET